MIRARRPRPPHALLTDDPGVVVHDPRRKLAQLLVLYALLPLICAAAGAFIVYELVIARIDQRVETLEAELAQRRAASAADNRARDARLEQTRRDLCVVVDRVQPRDAAVEDVRRRYGCTANPVAPSPTPSARPVAPGPSRTVGGAAGQVRDGGAATEPRPAPGPTGPQGPSGPPGPAPSSPPPPSSPVGGDLVCLPIVGCVL